MSFLNNAIVSFVKLLPQSVVHLFAKKYIAGVTLQDAINVTKDLNSKGIVATLDVLGEAITTEQEASESKEECLKILKAIDDNKLDANLSIKPTSLGLSIEPEYFYQNMKEILTLAKVFDNFVRVDMEDSQYTDSTIKYFKKLQAEFDNVGIVLQAYMRRTENDTTELNKTITNYRLCKGIYVEPKEIAFKDRQIIRDNFLKVLKLMLENGSYVGIATHDDYLVEGAYKIIEENNYTKDKYEFQMLYGVKEKLRDKINEDGHKIRVYVPYGIKWYAYSMRRMQENPEVAMHITKSVLKLD